MIRIICILLMMTLSTSAYGYSIGGELSTEVELSNEKNEDTEILWENYLRIDNAEIVTPYLGVNLYGKYAHDDEGDYTDVYSVYLQYSSFQNALEMKLGRFAHMGNNFLTIDGAELTVRTDYYFGATLFGGLPQYFDIDNRHINETFRDTGNRLYGGKIFLNGVKKTTGYLFASKEDEDERTIQELVGGGIGRSFNLGKVQFNTGGKVSYDTEQNDIYQGALRLYMKYGNLTVIADGTRYNVKEGSAYEDELLISNFLSGREDRISYTLQYAVTPNIVPYQSTVHTEMEVAGGNILNGEIYKLGVDLNYFKTIGVTSNIEGYYYYSEISNATGASAALDWHISRELLVRLESELLTLVTLESTETETEETVYSIYLSVEYDILKNLTVSIFGENNQETAYLPDNRYGVKAAYRF